MDSENRLNVEDRVFVNMISYLWKHGVLPEKAYRGICMLIVDIIKLDESDPKWVESRKSLQKVMAKSSKLWCVYRLTVQDKKTIQKTSRKHAFIRRKSPLGQVAY